MLDVRRLVLLREVARRGTLSAVAEALSYSPSAVSQQLAQLSREVGVPLLRPSGRRVVLTAEAQVLIRATGEVLDVLERAQAEVAQVHGGPVSGTVRLAVFQSVALALVPGMLQELEQDHPEVRVEVTQCEPGEALWQTWARDYDLVVAEEHPAHAAPHLQGLVRTELARDALRLALPPRDAPGPLAAAEGLEDVVGARWTMEPEGTSTRHFAEQMCRTHGFEPDVRYVTADLQTQIRLIEAGCAVALLPDLIWSGQASSCRLVDLPSAPHRVIFVAQREAGLGQPATAAVLSALLRRAEAQPWSS